MSGGRGGAVNSVLFVCYGNICRSPMGEAIFDDLAKKAGVRDKWLVDSAATSGHEAGSPIYSTAQTVLRKHSINYSHTARKIQPSDFAKYQLILGFDHENIKNLERMKPADSQAEIRLVNYFNPKRKNQPIADPWYPDTIEAFEDVYRDCYESSREILEKFK